VAHLIPRRIDQGVDYSGSGPIYALGPGVVVIAGFTFGWPGANGDKGGEVYYRLTDGPANGFIVFVAENVTPRVRVGDRLGTDTVVATLHDAYPNCEVGWGQSTGATLARAFGGYREGERTACGDNFSQLLDALGAPPGTTSGRPITGRLPNGLPTNWKQALGKEEDV